MIKNAAIVVIALLAAALRAGAFSFTVAPAPEWDALFQRTNGWIGSDVAYSIPLATNKTLWLFGDTLVGDIIDNTRTNVRMVHSSVAVQTDGDAPEFYYPTNRNGTPRSFIKSVKSGTAFWLLDGVRTRRGLFFFLQQIQWTGGGAFGFRVAGDALGYVDNPDDAPGDWKVSGQMNPYSQLPDGETVTFGIATLPANGFIYIYGAAYPGNDSAHKNLVLARAPAEEVDDFSAWQFFADGKWVKNFKSVTPLFSGAPPEGSVSWQPLLKKYVFIYTDGIGGKIVLRTANAPEGPWSGTRFVYQSPEISISPDVICYAGKGHPELSATNELLISYASNSLKYSEVLDDPRLYWPRFIRVTFTP